MIVIIRLLSPNQCSVPLTFVVNGGNIFWIYTLLTAWKITTGHSKRSKLLLGSKEEKNKSQRMVI